MAVAIGIDLGGTKIAGVVVDAAGTVLARTVIPTDRVNETTLVAGVAKVALELRGSAPNAARLGLAAAGLVDPYAGVILASPNLPARNLGIVSMIESRLEMECVLDNDANAAAYAEAVAGAGVGARHVVMVTIGTGIGGGIVIDRTLVRGAHGFAGELGHVIIDRNGPACGCGQRGCLEAFASGMALARVASEYLFDPRASAILEAVRAGQEVSGELIARLAVQGDAFALSIVEQAARALGLGLASISNMLDPDRFVIGGGAGVGMFDLLIGPATNQHDRHVLGAGGRPVPDLVKAALGEDAGAIGAGLIALAASPE